MSKILDLELTSLLGALAFALTAIAAWVTHVFWVIGTLSAEKGVTFGQAALGVIGTFVPPVGVLHGFYIWFT